MTRTVAGDDEQRRWEGIRRALDSAFRPAERCAPAIVRVMAGTEGLGRRVVGAADSPHAASLAASLDHLGFQVNRDNVLQTGAALMTEANRLNGLVRFHRPALRMQPPAADLVSGPATDEFNTKIQALADQCDADARVLTAAAVKLADDARRYGFTEQEITAAFGEVLPAPAPGGAAPGASG